MKNLFAFLFLSIRLHAAFFSSPEYSFQALRAISATAYGGADIGECLETFKQIIDGDDESWFIAFNELAMRLEIEASENQRIGHKESAHSQFLRASNYYRSAEFFLHSNSKDPRILATWQKSKNCFLQAVKGLNVQEVKIPFERTFLPGYFCKVDDQKRPLLILQTGFDGTAEELYITTAQAAVKRGYHCLIFEGPGQGAVIREQGMPFRPNWETVVSPVVDFAFKLSQVDINKVALMGLSFGGYLVPRALAFEKRVKVGIANGGIYDFHEVCMPPNIKDLEKLLDSADDSLQVDLSIESKTKTDPSLRWIFGNGMFTFGAKTPSEWLRMTRAYTLAPVIKDIQCKMLIVDSDGETFLKGQSRKVYDSLTGPKQFLLFRTTEGAGAHCQVGAYHLSNERIFNWLDNQLLLDKN